MHRHLFVAAIIMLLGSGSRPLCAQHSVPTHPPGQSQTSTNELLTRFESAEHSWQQAQVGEKLVTAGDLSVLPRMLELSKVSDRKRRCNAAFVLDGLGDSRGMTILMAELQDTKPRPIIPSESRGNGGELQQIESDRYYCANLLGRIGREEAVPALIELLKDEKQCYGAAWSLGNLGVCDAVDEIHEMADRFPQHRDSAAAALAALGDSRGLKMLADIVESKQNDAVRCRAIVAIQQFGSVRQQDVLLKALADPHPNIRVATTRALKAVGDSQSLPALRIAARDETTPPWHGPTTVRAEALAAIKAIEQRSP